MEYNTKLQELIKLKAVKEKDYEKALQQFNINCQAVISFEEVSGLKEELEEIAMLITALKKVFNKI